MHIGTVVHREPEWDDWERSKMLALDYLNAHMCDCGLPDWIADTDPRIKVEHRVCPTCQGLAVATRIQDAADDAEMKQQYGKNDPPPDGPRPDDGRHTSHRLKSDDED